jgi:hypothetical protein
VNRSLRVNREISEIRELENREVREIGEVRKQGGQKIGETNQITVFRSRLIEISPWSPRSPCDLLADLPGLPVYLLPGLPDLPVLTFRSAQRL